MLHKRLRWAHKANQDQDNTGCLFFKIQDSPSFPSGFRPKGGGEYSCKKDKLLIRAIYDIKQCLKLALSLKTLCKLKSPAKDQYEQKKIVRWFLCHYFCKFRIL